MRKAGAVQSGLIGQLTSDRICGKNGLFQMEYSKGTSVMERRNENGSLRGLLIGCLFVFCYCLTVGLAPHIFFSSVNQSTSDTAPTSLVAKGSLFPD